MTLALRYAARSHAGLLRPGNEDSAYAGPRLLAVADGVGGAAAGEVASAVAIAALAPLDEDVPGPDLLQALRHGAETANGHLRDMVAGDSALEGMGTTLVALLFAGGRLGLMHVGDSRCYLLRDGALAQITNDHTLVQALVDQGRISLEEASEHPRRNVVLRALDGRDDVELDLSVREVRAGDRYLLCSDGLTGPVASTDTLQEALSLSDPQQAADRLVALALKGGGPDNVTVVVADVVDEPSSPPGGVPVVAGAAAASPAAGPAPADSPAARARVAEGRDTAVAPPVAPPTARRRPARGALVAVAALVLLAAVAAITTLYVRTQYFVGVDAGQVSVFRGVSGSVAGVHFSDVETRTPLAIAALSEVDAARVRAGIVAADRDDAGRIVARLQRAAATGCPVPQYSQAPGSPSPLPAGTPTLAPRPTPPPPAGCGPR